MAKPFKPPLLLRITRWAFPKLERFSRGLATRLFVQLFFTPLHYGFPKKEQVWVQRAKRSWIEVNGKRVAVYEWGDSEKPYILFLHGWAGRGTQFRKFFEPFLDAGFRLVAFDGPAHGHSQGKRTNVLEFEQVVHELHKKFGPPAGNIAHSFGGTVALYCAMNGVVTPRLICIGTPVIAEKLIQSFLSAVNGSPATGESFRQYLREKYQRDFDEFSAQWFLPRIKQPMELFLIHDEHDRDVSIAHAEEAIRLYPSARFLRTSGLGHTRILKDESVIRECLGFFQRP